MVSYGRKRRSALGFLEAGKGGGKIPGGYRWSSSVTLGEVVTIQHFTSWYSSVNVPEEKRVAVGHTTASVQRLRDPAGT